MLSSMATRKILTKLTRVELLLFLPFSLVSYEYSLGTSLYLLDLLIRMSCKMKSVKTLAAF